MRAKLQRPRSLRDKKARELIGRKTGQAPAGWLELGLGGKVAGQAGPINGSMASIAALAGTL